MDSVQSRPKSSGISISRNSPGQITELVGEGRTTTCVRRTQLKEDSGIEGT